MTQTDSDVESMNGKIFSTTVLKGRVPEGDEQILEQNVRFRHCAKLYKFKKSCSASMPTAGD
jgi:hypothetical protein